MTVPVYGGDGGAAVAAVGAGDEVSSLQEAVASHNETIQQLLEELEEERSAAATAATETMAMILRLQRENTEIQMDARNFRRFADEKMAHDQYELDNLDDLLFKRDEAIHYLIYQVKAYRHRLLSHGIDPDTISDDPPEFDDLLVDDEEQMHEFPAAPTKGKTNNWEFPAEASSVGSLIMEKCIVGQSPENSPGNVTMDLPSCDSDDVTDRVCMIDTHGFSDSSKEKKRKGEVEEEEEQEGNVDIKKLYLRLQTLEQDRELMRQAIVSMRSEKAQLMLPKEMAQHLKEYSAPAAKKPSLSHVFISVAKWIAPFLFRRKKAAALTKYTFGISSNNVGLMLIIGKSPEITYWRCLIRDATITETSFWNIAPPPCSRTKSAYYSNAAGGILNQ